MGKLFDCLDRKSKEKIRDYDNRINHFEAFHAGYAFLSLINYSKELCAFSAYAVWNGEFNEKLENPLPQGGFMLHCSPEQAQAMCEQPHGFPIYAKLYSKQGRLAVERMAMADGERFCDFYFNGCEVIPPERLGLVFAGAREPVGSGIERFLTRPDNAEKAIKTPQNIGAGSYRSGSYRRFSFGSYVAGSYTTLGFGRGSYRTGAWGIGSYLGSSYRSGAWQGSYAQYLRGIGSFRNWWEWFGNSSAYKIFGIGSYTGRSGSYQNQSGSFRKGSFLKGSFLQGSFSKRFFAKGSFVRSADGAKCCEKDAERKVDFVQAFLPLHTNSSVYRIIEEMGYGLDLI